MCSPREEAGTDAGGGSGLEEAVSEVASYTYPLPSTLPEHRPSPATGGDSLVRPGSPRITTTVSTGALKHKTSSTPTEEPRLSVVFVRRWYFASFPIFERTHGRDDIHP